GEILNPEQKGPDMVLAHDDQGNQMYVSQGAATSTLLATSLGTTTGELNTVTNNEKKQVMVVLGGAAVLGSAVAGAVLTGLAVDNLIDKTSEGTATISDVIDALPLSSAAKAVGAAKREVMKLEAIQV